MNSAAIELDHLQVSRGGNEVLRGVSASVPQGEVAGLLGPSGCGKTTLMRSVVGVQKIAGGTVNVLGEPAGSPPLRSRVGYVTQAPSVYADLTIHENLRYFARVLNVPAERVDEVLAAVDLARSGGRLVGTLSGGQRSRVSLAAALLGRPELLVLDEPTVGLDPVLRRDLWGLFHRLADDGATLLVSSHVMDEAARCDSLLLMRDGELIAQTTPDELRERTGEQEMEAAFLRLIEERSG
ncbi:MAG TPA: ABC transporter ATP-binding protein [Solirubrobacteraceae bacterium]|nr:ABC transporter ATP-binding protein [Solirubrobacteraceae bacterium]